MGPPDEGGTGCFGIGDPSMASVPRATRLPAEECPALLFSTNRRRVGSDGQLVSARELPEEIRGPGAADVLLDAPELSAAIPHPDADRLSCEGRYAAQPPVQKLGHNWTDAQWLAKALELTDTFGSAENISRPAGPSPPSPRPAPKVPEARITIRLGGPGGEEENLATAIQSRGFDIIPDWYTALDRIYEVGDMAPFSVDAPTLAAAPGMAGAPGYSYVVPKGSPTRPQSGGGRTPRLGTGGGGVGVQIRPEDAMAHSDALLKRYQNRLLQTSLHGGQSPRVEGRSSPF